MLRRRISWLLVVPLMVAGSLAAHALGYALVPAATEGGHAESGELSGLHERASDGFGGHVVLWLGLVAALLGVLAVRALFARFIRAHGRSVIAGCFFLLPLLSYSVQESAERVLHAESFPFQSVLEPHFLFGLALQLPFALLAFLLAWVLFRAGQRLLRLLARDRLLRPHALPAGVAAPASVPLARVRPLSRGHPLRGPPLLA